MRNFIKNRPKMSEDLVKRQHYVWREYLRAWSEKDMIYTFNKHKGKIQRSNLMNVAQKRFFNKFHKVTGIEKQFLEYSCKDIKGPIKDILEDILLMTEIFSSTKEISEKIESDNKDFDTFEKNGYEVLHTKFENYGKNFIKCRNFNDIKFFDDDLSKFEALGFLCFQYFRTKKQRDSQIKTFANEKLDIDKIFSPLAIITALKVTQTISFDSKIRYIFLEVEKNSNDSLITTDQPVINLAADSRNKDGEVQDLIFYYPISPKHAIKITFDNLGDKYQHKILSSTEIIELNQKMKSEFNEFVFSDSEISLKSYT